MVTIGFNPKKRVAYFGDNEFSPTVISCYSSDTMVELNKVPYFQMNFRIERGYSIASGFECIVEDLDTGIQYSIPNYTIVELFQKIQEGTATVHPDTKSITATFSVQKKGRYLFLTIPSAQELEDMVQE